MQELNPYHPPQSNLRLEETTLKKIPVLLVFFFCFITYGIYVPFWYWRRRHTLNRIAPERRVNGLVIVAFVLLVAANTVGMANGVAESPLQAILAWSYVIVIMVLAFRVGSILETSYLEKVSGVGVFLLNLLYLQFKINRIRPVRSDAILSVPREDRRTAVIYAKGFGVGLATAVAAAIGLILAFAYFFTGPALAVVATAPSTVVMGETFTLSIEVRNPHDAAVELNSIDVPQRVLNHFKITATSPEQLGEPVGGLGSLTWYPEQVLEPGSSEVIEFEVEPLNPGRQVLELEVCNDFQDCSQIVRVIEVAAPGVAPTSVSQPTITPVRVAPTYRKTFGPGRVTLAGTVFYISVVTKTDSTAFRLHRCGEPCTTAVTVKVWQPQTYAAGDELSERVELGGEYYLWAQNVVKDEVDRAVSDDLRGDKLRITFESGAVVDSWYVTP